MNRQMPTPFFVAAVLIIFGVVLLYLSATAGAAIMEHVIRSTQLDNRTPLKEVTFGPDISHCFDTTQPLWDCIRHVEDTTNGR